MAPVPPIRKGDIIPDGCLTFLNEKCITDSVSIHSIANGKKIILLGVTGAFMPLCSHHHVAGYVEKADEFKSKGVQEILCFSANDPFEMSEWEKVRCENKGAIKFLSDTFAYYVKSLGLETDLSDVGYGIRSRRFALLIDNLRVKVAGVELRAEDMLVAMAETECIGHMPFEISPQLSDVEHCNFHRSRTNNRNLAPERSTPYEPMAPVQPIKKGDIFPDGSLTFLNEKQFIETVSTHSIANGKKIILLGVHGAFMPKCSRYHVTGYIEKADEFKSKGVQEIVCLSVNDPFEMSGWERARFRNNGTIKFLSDADASYVKSLGLELDPSRYGHGIRSERFALLIENLRVKVAGVELRAEDMLAAMAEFE